MGILFFILQRRKQLREVRDLPEITCLGQVDFPQSDLPFPIHHPLLGTDLPGDGPALLDASFTMCNLCWELWSWPTPPWQTHSQNLRRPADPRDMHKRTSCLDMWISTTLPPSVKLWARNLTQGFTTCKSYSSLKSWLKGHPLCGIVLAP